MTGFREMHVHPHAMSPMVVKAEKSGDLIDLSSSSGHCEVEYLQSARRICALIITVNTETATGTSTILYAFIICSVNM